MSLSASVLTSLKAVRALQQLSQEEEAIRPHVDFLARVVDAATVALSPAAPTRTATEASIALDRTLGLVTQYPTKLDISSQALSESASHRLHRALVCLWANVLTHQLHVALNDSILAVDFIPRALTFWKLQRKKRLRAKIESGPIEWFLPRSQRISIFERIRCLEATLDARLRVIGQLRQLLTKMLSCTSEEEQLQRLREADTLLDKVYSAEGIVVPRRGSVTALEPSEQVEFVAVHLRMCSFMAEGKRVASTNDVAYSLEMMTHHIKAFRRAQIQFRDGFALAMKTTRPPSKWRRRWLQLSIAAICMGTGGVWVVNNQEEFRAALKTLQLAFTDFFTEHMIEPIQAIVGEVLFNQKPEIQDPAALQDTKMSLQRMLSDFVRDTNPNVSQVELQRIMDNMDMSVVSLQYEKQLSSAIRNIMTGDIVRMLLIQVQFIKKELMVAMGAIDELMHANQLNLQMMATVPTFIVFGGFYKLLRQLFHQIYKRTSERIYYDPGEIAGMLRNTLRDIERLLNKQNRSPNGSNGADEYLGEQDVGFLVLLLHQLRDLFESHRVLFEEEVQERFEEDLNDLIEEGLLVSQQLAVIQRMFHSHPFLQRTKATSRWLLS